MEEGEEEEASSDSDYDMEEDTQPTTEELLRDMNRKFKKGIIKNKATTVNRAPPKPKPVKETM